MQAHADADGLAARPPRLGVDTLRLDGGRDRVARTWEDEEERVALRVDLDPVEGRERVADHHPVHGQHLVVAVVESLEELRRLLDVREDEGDRSTRQLGHAPIVLGSRTVVPPD